MFTFTVTLEGQSLLESAIAGSHPVLIDSILLTGTGDFSSISPVTSFSGSVIQSSADIGDYVVITFNDDNLNNSYIITNIALRSGLVNIATLEGISIEKEEGKSANYRFSCIFNGANKCSFNNTCIGLPYASKYRDGVIRLARSSAESNKLYTVYSASDVESLIEEAMSDSSLFVTWDLDAQSKPINGYTTVSCLTIKNGNNSISLTADSNSNLVVDGTAIASSVSSNSYIGSGIYSSYSENTWSLVGNNSKLPTVLAVRDAITTSATSITSAYQTADNSLQSQIDALNAGQNLADIVATKASLNALPTANLQTGDKVQVLADETHDSASTVYSLTKSGSTSTWTYIGKYGSDSYTKSEANNLFVENSQIKQSVDSAKQDEIPSSSAVASYVTGQISSAASNYVKISSVTTQSIVSSLSITGAVSINTVSLNEGTITSNYMSSGSSQYSYKLSAASPSDSSFRISQLKGTGTVSTITLDGDDNIITLFNGLGDLILSSSANLPHDINGDLVANYRDIKDGLLSDGRLVTVDYMNYAISSSAPIGVAYLSQDNTFTGNNTFSGGSGSDVKTTTFNSNVVLNTSPTGTGVCSSNSSWATASTQIPTVSVVKYAISESIPTNISYFNNDVGYITGYTETDPTVPSWAKQSTKPSYNLDEVTDGTNRTLLTSSDFKTISGQSIIGSGDITVSGDINVIESISVNSIAQTVTNKNVNITVPVYTSQLTNDSGFLISSDFKTINNESIVGSGNISIQGAGDSDIIPSSDNTYSLGSVSSKWNHIYVHSLHAWGNAPQYGVVLCDGNYESSAYSSITGYQSGSNGQMKFHHYNAANGIDYIVVSTGPNSTSSSTEATLTTEPQSDNTWTVGSSTHKLKAVYANSLHGLLETLYSSGKGAIYFFKLSITNKSSSTAYTVPRGTSLSDSAYFTTNSNATALLYINSYEERVDDTSASAGTTTFSGTYYTLMRFKVDAAASSKSVYVPCLRIS